MNIKPIGNKVLIKPLGGPGQIGRIIIPETAIKPTQEGTVVEIGNGDEIEVKAGDHVLYQKYGGTDIEVEGEKYKVIPGRDLMAVLE